MKSKNIDIYNIVLKLEQLYQNEIDLINDKSPFSNNKLEKAKVGLTSIMSNFVNSQEKVIKIHKILHFQNCAIYNGKYSDYHNENKPDKIICKYSIEELWGNDVLHLPNKKNIICKSCQRRTNELEEIIFSLHHDAEKQITPEIIKIKAIINLMNLKLKNYKQKI